MKKKQASKKARARRSPTEVSAELLVAVSGGAAVNQLGKSAGSPKYVPPPPQPSMVGQVINGVTVKKEWVNKQGHVTFGQRGEATGAKAVELWVKREKMQADFDKFGQGIVSALKSTPIGMAANGIANAAKTHSAGDAFKGMAEGAADAYTHGLASKVIDPLAAGKRGTAAVKDIAIGVGTTLADNMSRGFSEIAVSGLARAMLKGATQGANAAANKGTR